jgi:hypothetical protein
VKIVFLHIPKTAGQSVHQFLVDSFPGARVCPARTNEQLLSIPRRELNGYDIFSGHLDWCALDCVEGDKFTFTVLRDPLERILSFYFYLRTSAGALTQKELQKPQRKGMYHALNSTPYQYFVDPKLAIREFVDSHYDNFYTYYFAARRFDARRKILSQVGEGLAFSSGETVVRLALANMKELSKTYTVDNWVALKGDLQKAFGSEISKDPTAYRLNRGDRLDGAARLETIQKSEKGEVIVRRLRAFAQLDNVLWENAVNQSPVPGKCRPVT